MSVEFTVLSLLEDDSKIKRLEGLCQALDVKYNNATDSMDFLENVLEESINLMVFDTKTHMNEIIKTLEILQQDSLSKEIPCIIICDLNTSENIADSVVYFPVIALYPYPNWENQVGNLIRALALKEGQTHLLRDDLISTKEKNFLDPLTGALNRRGCERSFENLVGYYASNEEKFSLTMLDVDHFKKVNDTYGHDIGDEVLVGIAEIIRENIRKHDSFIRFGGEEFIILLADCDLNMANIKAEKIRQNIENSSLTKKKLNITASFGVVEYCEGRTLDNLIIEADALLYKAKDTGRNRVCF